MQRYAIVQNGAVTNLALWDGVAPWSPENAVAINVEAQPQVQIGWLYNGSVFSAPTPTSPTLNGARFEATLKTSVFTTFAIRNALAIQYPLFVLAMRDGNWPDVQAAILDANAKLLITPTQYATIKQAAIDNAIPIVLP